MAVQSTSEAVRKSDADHSLRPSTETGRGEALSRRRYIFWLTALFVLSLPFVNPRVRGDGIGYYAYARSLLINHDLNFEQDWLHGNASFVEGRLDRRGQILGSQYTSTGHIDNHFSVGPALLWSPFLLITHGIVLMAGRMGFAVQADGFSTPYRIAIAVSTAVYGFVGLLLAFDLARQYFQDFWSFLATMAIWFSSSLPVYMYFNPSWSHAHSAFAVSLFLWYWHRTRGKRTWLQWAALGAIGGLMIEVYYLNAAFLLVLAPEAIVAYLQILRGPEDRGKRIWLLLEEQALFGVVMILMLGPTFVTRWIIYGSPFESGYPALSMWFWSSPKFLPVLFSSDHGMLTWTPILAFALAGFVPLTWRDPPFGGGLVLAFITYFYGIASYVNWDGISSFGSRFFVSFTPVFVIGLAALFESITKIYKVSRAVIAGSVALLVLWNLGFVFQWGTQVMPARGPISWGEIARNQLVVPKHALTGLYSYFSDREQMMRQIEDEEIRRDHLQ